MRAPHPIRYGILFIPFGASSGFVSVTLAWEAERHGLPLSAVASLVAMTLLPHTWKFLWAPITDATLSRRIWYAGSNLLTSGAILALGLIPMREANLPLLQAMAFLSGVTTTFTGMATEALMAYWTPPEARGRSAGWSQAGNLGGAGVGGGLGLVLAQLMPERWMAPTIVAVSLAACSLALLGVPEPPRDPEPVGRRFLGVFRALWDMLRTRAGLLCVALCFFPLGSGAAQGLFAGAAGSWHASANLVAWMNGWLAGAVAAAGCLVGGFLSDAMNRKLAYGVAGVALAVVALAMGLAPRVPASYAVGVVAYNLAVGVCYGTFTGFVLEVIGRGAAATKYNVFASLSNVPIWYMTTIDGWAGDRYGASGMLLIDAASGAVGLVLLLATMAALGLLRAPTQASGRAVT